jgi:hypothetical protein
VIKLWPNLQSIKRTIYHLRFNIYYPASMKKHRRLFVFTILITLLIALLVIAGREKCPSAGLALTEQSRKFYRLKNRTSMPQPGDFNPNVSLSALLQPGPDVDRWSSTQAAVVEGYVVSVAPGPLELTNCYIPGRRDTHIHIGLRADAPPAEQVVLETTPRLEDWAQEQGWDWSAEALKATLTGRKVRFEGWLMFDESHAGESENMAPRRPGNWRATAWEVHPVTSFQILE